MKIKGYVFPKGDAFQGISKDMSIIVERILSNQNVLKLLEYNVRDWKSQPSVTNEQIEKMLENEQISPVPRLRIEKQRKTYLRLNIGTVVPNANNPEFFDNTFGIDILCHYDDWNLGNFQLRPLRIAGEIQSMLDKTHLDGIGVLNFITMSPVVYNAEYAGVSLTYLAVRGHEDQLNMEKDRGYQSSLNDRN